MRYRALIILLFALGVARITALDAPAYFVDVRVHAQASPARITLSWPQNLHTREYVIRRKNLHENYWSSHLATLPGHATEFIDANVSPGLAYEYAIEMATTYYPYPAGDPSSWTYGYSYVCAGIDVALQESKGKVLLVIDSSVAAPLQNELAQFQQNLVGSGWTVIRRELSRSAPVPDVRNLIRSEYNADPAQLRSVILIGHVPVPYSGNIAPDLHSSHRGAWPADGYYAEMDGIWTDHAVSVTSEDHSDNDNFPGDGKFDQSTFPSPVELEIGRIDFWNMTSFLPASETDLLRRYFQKNHQFRHRAFTAARRGLIRDNFGDLNGDAPAVDAWRHFGLFFGPGNIRQIGPNSFFSTLNSESFLWSYGAGGGGYKKADSIGSTPDFALNSPQSVFMMLHGSYFGDWNNEDNFLRAAIAGPGYTLAGIWSGLPHWFMHHLALGKTLGYSTRLTQNNFNLYKSNRNFSAGEVHVALLGDPTLEVFPVIPPSGLSAQAGASVNLAWNPSPDSGIVGYHVYHSTHPSGPYQRISASPVSTSYSHAVGPGTHHYMVRAIKLEVTGSGSFYNASQGIFTSVGSTGVGLRPTISEIADQTLLAGSSTADIPFIVTDADTPASSLTLRGGSSDPNLVRPEDIQFGGAGENRTVRVTAASSAVGQVKITVIVSDGSLEATRNFFVQVEPPNQPPAAHPQQLATDEDTALPILLSGTDPEGAPLQFFLVDQPAVGIVTGSAPNLIYTPAPNHSGPVSLTFYVSDGELESSTATVDITINEINDPPAAGDDSLVAIGGYPLTRELSLLTGNDSDLEDPVTFQTAETSSVHGGVISVAPPNFTYSPAPGFTGTDSFTYSIVDSGGLSATATVTVEVSETPRITQITAGAGGSFILRFNGPPNSPYTVRVCTTGFSWSDAATGLTDADGQGEFIDEAPNAAAQYYKVEWPSAP